MEDRRRPRKTFLQAHSFEVAIAFAALLTSLQFIFDPSVRAETTIGSLGTTSSWMWAVLYLFGAVGILWGMLGMSDRIEIAGLSCFTAACLVNAFGLWQIRGDRAVYIAITFLALAIGGWFRIVLLLKLKRILAESKSG